MNRPTPQELRTAARVIRWITMSARELIDKEPLPQRLWSRLTTENGDEMMRKSALLENIADEFETHESKA